MGDEWQPTICILCSVGISRACAAIAPTSPRALCMRKGAAPRLLPERT
jgi:hypothetical protein